MTKPDNLVTSDFMTNLGTDHLAVNAGGHVVGRASTAEAIRKAVPDAAHYLTAKDIAEPVVLDGAHAHDHDANWTPAASEPHPVSAGLDAVVAQQAPADDVKPDADPDASDDKAPAKTAAKKVPAKK